MSEVSDRMDRIEKALVTMAWWLVQAQTGFGERDARGIEDILATGDFDDFKQAASADGEESAPSKGTG